MEWGNSGPICGMTPDRGTPSGVAAGRLQANRDGTGPKDETSFYHTRDGPRRSMARMRFCAQVLLAEDVPTFLAGVTAFLGDTVHDLLFSAGRAPAPAANHGTDNGHVQGIHRLATSPLLSEPQRDPAGPVHGKTSDRASSAAAAARRVSSSSPLSARMTASRNSCAPIMRGTRTNPAPS